MRFAGNRLWLRLGAASNLDLHRERRAPARRPVRDARRGRHCSGLPESALGPVTGKLPPRLEPVEIQHVRLSQYLLGYSRRDIDRLLEVATSSFEEVWFERDTWREQVERLQVKVHRTFKRDRLVGDLVRNAQQTAIDTVAEARETAEAILVKARKKADRLLIDAERDLQRLREEISVLRAFENALHERFRAFASGADRVLDEGREDTAASLPSRSPEKLESATRRRSAEQSR